MNKQNSQSVNDKNNWVKPALMIGGGLLVVSVIIYLIAKKKKD